MDLSARRVYPRASDNHDRSHVKVRSSVTITRPVEKRLADVKKLSLAEMLKNAKKVDKEFVQPIRDDLLSEGIIPCPITDEYMSSVEEKALAFPRKFESSFLAAYGESYHEYRRKCWLKARGYNRCETSIMHRSILRASARNWAFDPQFLSIGPPEPGTVRREFDFKVKLPLAYYRDVDLTLGEELHAMSGKISAVPDQYRNRELEYVREYEAHFTLVALTELEELKHIYKTFWYSQACSEQFLLALYTAQGEDLRIEGFTTQRRTCLDSLYRQDDIVVFSLNGSLAYITVDLLYSFIEASRRFERRQYAYGEGYSEAFILFAVWLWHRGVSAKAIIEELTPSMINDAFGTLKEIHEAHFPPRLRRRADSSMGDEESLPSWVLRVQQGIREDFSDDGSHWSGRDIARLERQAVLDNLPSFEDAVARIMEAEAGSSLATSSLIVKRSEHSFLSHISAEDSSLSARADETSSEVFSTFSTNTNDDAFLHGFVPSEDFSHVALQDLHSFFYENEGEVRKLNVKERERLTSVRPNHWVRDKDTKYQKYICVKFGKGKLEPRASARRGWKALRAYEPP